MLSAYTNRRSSKRDFFTTRTRWLPLFKPGRVFLGTYSCFTLSEGPERGGYRSHFPATIFFQIPFSQCPDTTGYANKTSINPFPFFFSDLNPSPSEPIPFSQYKKQANPNSHFTPSGTLLSKSSVFLIGNIKSKSTDMRNAAILTSPQEWIPQMIKPQLTAHASDQFWFFFRSF